MCENFDIFSILQGHLAKIIRDINNNRMRTRQRYYPETIYKRTYQFEKRICFVLFKCR